MTKLTERTYTTGTTRRCVQTFTRGIRCVTFDHGGESWTSYLIVPRQTLNAGIRHRRAGGAQWHDCDWWSLVPGLDQWGCPAGNGGPGRPFANAPHRCRSSRRFVIMGQSGGLDI